MKQLKVKGKKEFFHNNLRITPGKEFLINFRDQQALIDAGYIDSTKPKTAPKKTAKTEKVNNDG